jgi:hypothetical protein
MKILIFVFAIGGLIVFIVSGAFPPIGYDALVFGSAAVWLIGTAVLGWAAKNDDGDDTDSYYPKKRYMAIAFLPWAVGALLYVNGALDSSAAIEYPAVVLSHSKGRYGTDIRVSPLWPNHGAVTIPIEAYRYDSMQPGTPVQVLVRRGALSISWISEVKRP